MVDFQGFFFANERHIPWRRRTLYLRLMRDSRRIPETGNFSTQLRPRKASQKYKRVGQPGRSSDSKATLVQPSHSFD